MPHLLTANSLWRKVTESNSCEAKGENIQIIGGIMIINTMNGKHETAKDLLPTET